jgi:hypothetical protein
VVAVLGVIEQSVSVVQAVPESARLLLLGLGLLWCGAALRRSFRIDHAVESDASGSAESVRIRTVDFRLGNQHSGQELVDAGRSQLRT